MKDVRVYDLSGQLRLIVHDYLRLVWTEKYTDCGSVSLFLLTPHPLFDLISAHKSLILSWDGRQAIITSYLAEDGTLKVNAKPLITLLSRRILPADGLELSGKTEDIVRQIVNEKANYISVQSGLSTGNTRKVVIEKTTDLLTAAKQVLAGQGIGMRIGFNPSTQAFSLSFLYPNSVDLRLSTVNRNITEERMRLDLAGVHNAGYATEPFKPTLAWNAGSNQPYIENGDPANYMKQYRAVGNGWLGNIFVEEDDFLYCDTPDGKWKFAQEKQDGRVHYIALETNPVEVFEADLLKYTPAQATSLLSLRSRADEDFAANACNVSLNLGDVVQTEKTAGQTKGLKQMQVREITFDTALPQPQIGLMPFENS